MLNAFRKTCGLMDKLFVWAAVLLLAVIIGASSVQVFTRYVMNASLIGTEELARFAFIWMSMLGGSVCVSRNAHPAVTFIGDFLHGNTKKALSTLIYILIILCSLIFIVYGYRMYKVTGYQLSPTLGIRMSLIYLAIPVGGVGMVANAILGIFKELSPTSETEQEAKS